MIIEFRRHREVTNPAHIIGFLSQWKLYLEELPDVADAKGFNGKKLDTTSFEKVSSLLTYGMQSRNELLRCLTDDHRAAGTIV